MCIRDSFSAMNVGLGWKLSVQESVVERTISGALWLVYGDADGTEHYFYDFDSDGKYESEDGYGLTITRNTASTSARYTMHDDYGSSKTFNSTGRLVRIDDEMCIRDRSKTVVRRKRWIHGRDMGECDTCLLYTSTAITARPTAGTIP